MRSFLLAIGLVLLPASSICATQDQNAEAKAALLAASCSGCHAKTESEDGFPSIYGRPAAEIRDLLLSFRSGQRESTVMNRLAKGYDDKEIELLSGYIAAQGTAH
ncbi:c-type cytochrome [Methyloceanibacter caenitepidi]|uniref:Cytochrome c class I n=1 Tax=Methyloceanibacter caenitepidi TaxID=1384459 RepID=A0A0A8K0T1_9HYPH|nr:cytochrome C [Methyloceanibacter caenitepidi]BAQ16117.1 cytochrome c class I [Methyloceanibacter caenitepidi]